MSFYNLIGIEDKDWQKSVTFPTTGRKVVFSLLCGLPGTGKSTLAEKIKNSYTPDEALIINRDKIRVSILWEIRKEEKKDQEKILKNLDNVVTERIIDIINTTVSKQKYWGIIIDGCHTDWKIMSTMLFCLERFENTIINIYIVGTYESGCKYTLSNKKEGDYSDYKTDASHQSIPLCVFERKRKEMRKLLNVYLAHIYNYADFITFIPSIK